MKLVIIDLRDADEALVAQVLLALPEARRLELERRRFPDRARGALSEAVVRAALSRACGVPAGRIALARGEHGKPCCPETPALAFNISHSGELAVCGFDARALGVDVERTDRRNAERIAARCFTARENAQIAASPSPRRAFYRLWTAKESAVKWLGTGLADLRGVEIDGDTPRLRGETLPCHIQSFELRPGDGRLSPFLSLPEGEALCALSVCLREEAAQEIQTRFVSSREAAQAFLARCDMA